MKIRITRNHVDALCVLIGVLGMGSLYFQVLRMPLMAAMLIASILLLTRAHHPKISAQNIRLTLLLTAALLLTSFVNPQNGIHINDIVIWLCNIGYVLVLQSCIGYRTYMRLYTKVMLAEAAISLISFVIGDLLSLPLPLLHYEASSVNGFYLTPYFTLGWLNIPVFHRNAGMFNEPGSHQIFLNFALLFLMSDETRMGMSKKKYCWAIALLIVTILSMYQGFLGTDGEKLRLMRSLGATRGQILWMLVFPASFPTLFNTLKVNVGLSWVGVIMGEFLVSRAGLGYLIVYGSQVFNMDLVMASVVILAAAAVVMYRLVLGAEKLLQHYWGVKA